MILTWAGSAFTPHPIASLLHLPHPCTPVGRGQGRMWGQGLRSCLPPPLCRSGGGDALPPQDCSPAGFLLPPTPLVIPFNVGNITAARQDAPQHARLLGITFRKRKIRICLFVSPLCRSAPPRSQRPLFCGHQISLPKSPLRLFRQGKRAKTHCVS